MGPNAEVRRLWLGVAVGFALATGAGAAVIARAGDPRALTILGAIGAGMVGALGTNLVLLRLAR